MDPIEASPGVQSPPYSPAPSTGQAASTRSAAQGATVVADETAPPAESTARARRLAAREAALRGWEGELRADLIGVLLEQWRALGVRFDDEAEATVAEATGAGTRPDEERAESTATGAPPTVPSACNFRRVSPKSPGGSNSSGQPHLPDGSGSPEGDTRRKLHALGTVGEDPTPAEVIDPEALVWCSLEFAPTDERVCAALLAFLRAAGSEVMPQRLKKLAKAGADPRATLWHALSRSRGSAPPAPDAPCHGLASRAEVEVAAAALAAMLREVGDASRERAPILDHAAPPKAQLEPARLGDPSLLWRARRLFGTDARHLMLLDLLAHPNGASMRALSAWSGYSYRRVGETAAAWRDVGQLRLAKGVLCLNDPSPWRALLGCERERPLLVDWFGAFGTAVQLLRRLRKSAASGIDVDGIIITAARKRAAKELSVCVRDLPIEASPALCALVQRIENLS